ncbi:sulfate transporter [Thioalkalivibrio sp. K90mix]|jgi:SulP family sulfate permease|uniref:SulP family inorganic anion transporter n=1 Tax=unclassified Thioalkalivibrio TaxID=2621013 RepID=UPI000195AAB8|nr:MULTISPECIES: SulP family inorganic anion transporter [unclassified Thioalkalivibrio]ADC71412.1 sulfate transporter [Thioalkalivibrio sp. K90mix]
MNSILLRIFPFLSWRPTKETLNADLIAGISVALVLIPQSMAYAQLAGLPPVYGLYASLLPVMVAALWGSSNQLATGPVAVVSLLTASALVPLAAEGSSEFIMLAIALALIVGVIQLVMGLFKLGALVSFISHPVIVGFTNAAAIIIGLSQINKLLGVPIDTSGHFLLGLWGVVLELGHTHWPTLAFGLGAIALMVGMKRVTPKIPGVLVAVVVTILISWLIGYERKADTTLAQIAPSELVELAQQIEEKRSQAADLDDRVRELEVEIQEAARGDAPALRFQQEQAELQRDELRAELVPLRDELRNTTLRRLPATDDEPERFIADDHLTDAERERAERTAWRIERVDGDEVSLNGGGAVVGNVPQGLPSITAPEITFGTITTLLTTAFVIALVGFTEAIAIAKAMAARTGQRLDPSKELMGQGLANIAGGFTQGYPVSGSFSRSAVNLNSGARTGLASVFTAVIIGIALLFLTPLIYHLPQSVLAAIIMMAVVGLINFKAIKHAWVANKHDGAAAVVTFIATLAMAPNLDYGILMGAGLAIVLYLYRTMQPRVCELARFEDGTLREAQRYGLETNEKVGLMRFDGSLYFANVPYFEDAVLDLIARHPQAKYLIVVGKGINEIDASGEEVIHQLVHRLKARGITLVFAGVKAQVLEVMQRTGLEDIIGKDNIFKSTDHAVKEISERVGEPIK